MNQANLRAQLQPVVDALREALGDDLAALVLFGSRARGDANPESDWDLLLLVENLPASPLKRIRYVDRLLPEAWRYRLNVLAQTPTQWFRRVTPLALDIALDGIVLYDNPRYALTTRLAALREQVHRLGLGREQIAKGEWLWQWEDDPQTQWEMEWTL